MKRGESYVGNADIDILLLDFMRVILVQHQLLYGDDLNDTNASVRLNLKHSVNLFQSLQLEPQSASTQWMLIIKLYRMGCLKEINGHFNGKSSMEAELFFNYHFDYQTMDDEVELVLVPAAFKDAMESLDRTTTKAHAPAQYTCRLFLRDNKVMLSIDDRSFQVARMNGGSMIERLLQRLERLPSSEILSAIDFEPNRKDINFVRLLDKYDYKWIKPMLSVCKPTAISIQNPAELDIQQLLVMVPEIAENYRQPIARYLGIDETAAEYTR